MYQLRSVQGRLSKKRDYIVSRSIQPRANTARGFLQPDGQKQGKSEEVTEIFAFFAGVCYDCDAENPIQHVWYQAEEETQEFYYDFIYTG